ncbi:hypothetical protein BLNAU_13574 [Blattamonas nauphoetae]|uniref:Uncharacterized protein n=1 Tax=Blattamonas nauphoetae TaxID=2049346 RepID=A0ABQ9XLB3_9EUKA|nr:hypothetical protein BLNAU_13574 [Blattamonas nauphoetae]
MIGSIGNFFSSRAKKKKKSQQQLDNPIAQPRAESGKKDKEATSIQVGKEDGLEEGETVEEEGETGNFQNRTEEEENTNHSPSQPNSSFESSQSPPSSPIQLKRTLRQRDPVTKQAITGNRLKSNFSHPLNSTSSQTPKERQKQSPKLPNRRRPPKRVGKSPVPIHQPPLTPISPLPLVYDSDIANQFLMSLKSETGRERQKQKEGRAERNLNSTADQTIPPTQKISPLGPLGVEREIVPRRPLPLHRKNPQPRHPTKHSLNSQTAPITNQMTIHLQKLEQ